MKHFDIGRFTAYQMLADVERLVPRSLVTITADDLGPGAKLGNLNADLDALRQELLRDGRFRTLFRGSPTLAEIGHLLCETRQNSVARFSDARIEHILEQFDTQRHSPNFAYILGAAAQALAAHAIPTK